MPYAISTLLTRNLHDVVGENDPARPTMRLSQHLITTTLRNRPWLWKMLGFSVSFGTDFESRCVDDPILIIRV